MEPSVDGIGPVSRLTQRSKLMRLVRLPSVSGIEPFRRLPYSSLQTCMESTCSGNCHSMMLSVIACYRLCDSYMYWRFSSSPRSESRGPEMPALPKSLQEARNNDFSLTRFLDKYCIFQSSVVDTGLVYCIRPDDVSEILNSGKVQIGMIILAPIGN